MNHRTIPLWICLFIFLFAVYRPVVAGSENGDMGEQVREPVRESVEIRRQTQAEHEQWQREKEELIARYERLEAENRRLAADRERVEKQVSVAAIQVERKEKQLYDIRQITDGIDPFLNELVSGIKILYDEGPPFLQEERIRRIESLERLLADPDAATAERFRRVMEALLIEAEYGGTIDVYQKNIDVSGRSMLANIFRLGRISLFYQTMDRQESGWFNMADNQWEPLPRTYNRQISSAIDIGMKRQPVELLTIPLGRMVAQ